MRKYQEMVREAAANGEIWENIQYELVMMLANDEVENSDEILDELEEQYMNM